MSEHEPSADQDATFGGQELAEELLATPDEHEPRPQDSVASFETARGSVYTYDETGRTSRFKTAAGEQQPTQDLTVFVDVSAGDFLDVLRGVMTINPRSRSTIHIIEQTDAGQVRVIEQVEEVQQADRLALAVVKDGEVVASKSVSLFPEVGRYPYDCRTFEEAGTKRTERHIGHKVTAIHYRA